MRCRASRKKPPCALHGEVVAERRAGDPADQRPEAMTHVAGGPPGIDVSERVNRVDALLGYLERNEKRSRFSDGGLDRGPSVADESNGEAASAQFTLRDEHAAAGHRAARELEKTRIG